LLFVSLACQNRCFTSDDPGNLHTFLTPRLETLGNKTDLIELLTQFPIVLRRSDDLPVRILKELTSPSSFQWNFRESYSGLARRLGADEETIRLALKRAIDSGAILGWRLVLNPDIFGGFLAGIQLDVLGGQDRKYEAISKIKLIEGVILVLDFHGTGLRIVSYYDSQKSLERKIDLIKSICDYKGKAQSWKTELPKCDLRLREIDWRILKSIRKNPRRDVSEVANEAGVSTRTANRRIRAMVDSKVAYLIPIRNVKKSKGVLSCCIVSCTEDKKKEIEGEILSSGRRVDFGFNSAKDMLIITLALDNLEDADEVRAFISRIQGVEGVRMDILREFIFVDGWLDDLVERKAKRTI